METKLLKGDCLELLKDIPSKSIDLVVTDPPYLLDMNGGGADQLSQRARSLSRELLDASIVDGYNPLILDEIIRVMKVINCYIWCNDKQIPMYLDKFAKREGCIFDILVWIKTNPIPIYNNHYLKDKEYCLYFRGKEGAYCRPPSVDMAKTYSFQEINAKDKKMYNHPTIKPINMIAKSIINSSREGDTILDPFMGSGTSGVACVRNNRNFIGMEINQTFFNLAKQRIENEQKTLRLF